MALLTGNVITVALNRTVKGVDLRDSMGVRVCTLTREQVDDYLARGYEAHGDKRHVRYLCQPRPRYVDRRVFEADASFWAGRGCLRFWKDQVSPGYGSRVDAFV